MVRKVLAGAAITLLSVSLFFVTSSHAWQVCRLLSIADSLPFRVVRGRLRGFSYRPLQYAREDLRRAALLRLRTDANRFLHTTSDDHLRGNASLLLGKSDAAVELLGRAAAAGDARAWSDLAAALIERGTTTESADSILDGLAAVQRAVEIDPVDAAAQFNTGAALEELGLISEAKRAFDAAALLEDGSDWSREASLRARSLTSGDPTAEWSAIESRLRDGGDPELAIDAIANESGTARRAAESTYLVAWAAARLNGRAAEAQRALSLARLVGRALLKLHHERLVSDAIAAIDVAESRGTAMDLARAHVTYDEGRTFLRARDAARAIQKFDEAAAAFARAGSPMELVAKYYASSAFYNQANIDAMMEEVVEIEAANPEAKGYLAMAAQAGWNRGVCLLVRGRHTDAAEVFSQSRTIAFKIRDALLVAQFDSLSAEAVEYLGQIPEAWRLRTRALRAFSGLKNDQRKTVTLMTAANLKLAQRQWRRCAAILDVAVPLAISLKDPVLATHTLAQRAIAHEEMADREAGAADRARAAIWLQKITEPAVHQRLAVELEVARGVALRVASPRDAVAHFERAINQFLETGELAHLPRLYLERGRAYEALGQLDRYRSDLVKALEVIESWGGGVEDIDKRAALNVWSETIRRDAIDLELRTGNVGAAFEHAERGRSVRDTLSLAAVSAMLADDAAVVEFALIPRGMVAFVIRHRDARAVLLRASVESIAAAADHFRSSKEQASTELDSLVVAPIRPLLTGIKRLLIVPEREMSGIPFGALYDEAHGHFLVEDMAILHAPSTTVAMRLSAHQSAPVDRALIIGANQFDETSAAPLRSVSQEINAVSSLWPRSTILTGRAVTAASLRRELPRSGLVHYAGHIIRHGLGPTLLLSDGPLPIDDIAGLHLDHTGTVVLAACRGVEVTKPYSVITDAASAFLLAGTQTVIASAVDVNDAESPARMVRLHKLLANNIAPEDAVRQLTIEERRASTRDTASAHLMVIGGSRNLITMH